VSFVLAKIDQLKSNPACLLPIRAFGVVAFDTAARRGLQQNVGKAWSHHHSAFPAGSKNPSGHMRCQVRRKCAELADGGTSITAGMKSDRIPRHARIKIRDFYTS
jgi:hypothetical protein